MGLFSNDKKDAAEGTLRAEHDRLDALAVDALAGEVLARAFGPETGNVRNRVAVRDIYAKFDPTGTGLFPGLDRDLVVSVQYLVEEGLQHLTHASLLVQGASGSDYAQSEFHLSRAGRRHLGY